MDGAQVTAARGLRPSIVLWPGTHIIPLRNAPRERIAPLAALLVLIALLCAQVAAQQTAGYAPDTDDHNAPLVGTWLNRSLYAHDGGEGVPLWQRLEIRTDGEMVHDYFYVDPSLDDAVPAERVFSRWSAGQYTDPDPAQGTYRVIRIAPYESHSLVAGTRQYRRVRGSFIPVYRRFSLSEIDLSLSLSEPVILVVPFVDQLLSFPPDAAFLDYARHAPTALPSAVAPSSWGWIKERQKRANR